MRKEFRHILRDPWALAIVTVGAALLMVLLAYTFSADIENVPLAVWDGDRSPESRAYLQRFANDEFFDLKYWAHSQEEVHEWVVSGQARAGIIIPSDFAATTQRGEMVPVQFIVDGAEPNTANQVLGNAEALSARFSFDLLQRRLADAGLLTGQVRQPFEFHIRALYNSDLREVNNVLPGLMAIVLAMPALSTTLSLVREKEQGTLEGLMATPIRRYQLLAGKVIPYLLIGLVDILLFTAIGIITFGIPFRGSLADLVSFSGLFLLANLGIGLVISSLVRTQMSALVIAGLIFTMPPIIQSGIFFPLYAMSAEAQREALLFPATHYVTITRGIFLKGVGMQVLLPDGLYLAGFGLLLAAFAAWRFKGKLD
jgi:ABC-2 type transport system permease protein